MTDREFKKHLQEKLKQKMRDEVQADRKPPKSEKLKLRRSKAG